jgi:ABC-type antimicrobial peptide transport system permease subunit
MRDYVRYSIATMVVLVALAALTAGLMPFFADRMDPLTYRAVQHVINRLWFPALLLAVVLAPVVCTHVLSWSDDRREKRRLRMGDSMADRQSRDI